MADGRTPPALRRLCLGGAALVAVVALVVFFGGWVGGVLVLRNVVPGTVTMKWQTSLGLLAVAVALMLLADPAASRALRRSAHLLAAMVIALGLMVLAEYVLGWNPGVDQLFFRDTIGRALGVAHPGRLAPTTAASFVLTGGALLLLDVGLTPRWRLGELLVAPVGALGGLTLVGYLYEIPALYGPASAAKMALSTGICFVSISAAILLARPHGRLVTLATTDDPGGIMTRRLLPVAVLLPLGLGWVRLRLEEHGVFGTRVGTWWLTASTIVVFGILITRVAAQLSVLASRSRLLEAELVSLANHDALTGLYNRRRFDHELAHATEVAARSGTPCSLLVIDLDRLKVVNDALGHPAGDALLQQVAEVLRARLRTADVCARIGGDEFGVVLPATSVAGACVLGQVLCDAVAAIRVPTAAGEAWTTVSVGVAAMGTGTSSTLDAFIRADQAMYRAKRAGGGRVARGREVASAV